jgi:hypothetical protein
MKLELQKEIWLNAYCAALQSHPAVADNHTPISEIGHDCSEHALEALRRFDEAFLSISVTTF